MRFTISRLFFGNNDTLYVAYHDVGNGSRATVARYNGTDWEAVGSAGFSAGMAVYPSLALDSNRPRQQ
jgi:hypothetical protein